MQAASPTAAFAGNCTARRSAETLYMLEHSFRNLQRAGFREVYEKESLPMERGCLILALRHCCSRFTKD